MRAAACAGKEKRESKRETHKQSNTHTHTHTWNSRREAANERNGWRHKASASAAPGRIGRVDSKEWGGWGGGFSVNHIEEISPSLHPSNPPSLPPRLSLSKTPFLRIDTDKRCSPRVPGATWVQSATHWTSTWQHPHGLVSPLTLSLAHVLTRARTHPHPPAHLHTAPADSRSGP